MALGVLVLVIGLFALVVVGPGAITWRARRHQKREDARLLRASTEVLLAEARSVVRDGHWERFAPARALLQDDRWTDAALVRVLLELYAVLSEDDTATGRLGPAGNVFQFYDCGLASILEALEKRTAPAPHP